MHNVHLGFLSFSLLLVTSLKTGDDLYPRMLSWIIPVVTLYCFTLSNFFICCDVVCHYRLFTVVSEAMD